MKTYNTHLRRRDCDTTSRGTQQDRTGPLTAIRSATSRLWCHLQRIWTLDHPSMIFHSDAYTTIITYDNPKYWTARTIPYKWAGMGIGVWGANLRQPIVNGGWLRYYQWACGEWDIRWSYEIMIMIKAVIIFSCLLFLLRKFSVQDEEICEAEALWIPISISYAEQSHSKCLIMKTSFL